MGAQLSLKAALPLAERNATSDCCNNTGAHNPAADCWRGLEFQFRELLAEIWYLLVPELTPRAPGAHTASDSILLLRVRLRAIILIYASNNKIQYRWNSLNGTATASVNFLPDRVLYKMHGVYIALTPDWICIINQKTVYCFRCKWSRLQVTYW